MAHIIRTLISATLIYITVADDFKDFNINSDEVMIAQESRQYQTVLKPALRIVKPNGVTNSHRPQYNLDSLESDGLGDVFVPTTKRPLVRNYKSSANIRSEGIVKEAVLKALERRDHVGKFAQILPIIRAMSGSQRVALASLVASQVTTVPGKDLNLTQVRSIIGDNANTTEFMLPLLYDTANLIRRAVRPGKDIRDIKQPQMLRRTFIEDLPDFDTTTQSQAKHRIRRIIPPRTLTNNSTKLQNTTKIDNITDTMDRTTRSSLTTEPMSSSNKAKSITSSRALADNSTLDLMADSTNQSLVQDLPVAEKLRALNRYLDRKVPGSFIRRGTYPPKPVTRRPTVEPGLPRRRPLPARKLPSLNSDPTKCDLFTNTLCLHTEDYPTDAIVQSIRRNKAAAGALLADFKDPGEGALDGVTADQEAKYTADHYLVSNRRGDSANRDFAGAGEAGFMCPSTVKYARPQRARATSGQWKYIVNTGEHTQTLRLEKCLKPKESCTYLTDNFKSKCVQVYNYHRLLTWDQQNGLHMDIFKVPTCCSCHIEGYSVSFPPLGHRIHETSSEHFPGEDLSSEHGNNAFESVQSTVQRPRIKSPPYTQKPDSFSPFSDKQNLINSPFSKINDNDETNQLSSNPLDSYGNSYFPDSFNQASSIKSIRRPPTARNPAGNNFDSVTLPSYLEPPTLAATSTFSFAKDSNNKFKLSGSPFKRGAVRPRPIRKKTSGGLDDLSSSGSAAVESLSNSGIESNEAFDDYLEERQAGQPSNIHLPNLRVTIAPKLHSVTTEVYTVTPVNDNTSTPTETFSANGKRVNYNYHPIIDFFDNVDKNDDQSIDRGDSESSYTAQIETGWKPIKHLPARSIQSSDLNGRKNQS